MGKKKDLDKKQAASKSFTEQKNIKRKSFFIAPHEDQVIMKHEEIDVMQGFADFKKDEYS